MAGAMAVASSLSRQGCYHITKAGNPSFQLCSVDEVFEPNQQFENIGRRFHTHLWEKGLGAKAVERIRERYKEVEAKRVERRRTEEEAISSKRQATPKVVEQPIGEQPHDKAADTSDEKLKTVKQDEV